MDFKLPLGWEIIALDETQSTNEDAINLPKGADKVAVLASQQIKGKGRLERQWISPKGNVYLSLCIQLKQLQNAGFYSFVSAIALAEAIKQLCPSLDPKCKWPNDILIDGKKVSGILLETDGVSRLVIGVGINLILPNADGMLYPITSLKTNGYDVNVETMVNQFISIFAKWQAVYETDGFEPILQAWQEKAYGLGEPMTANLPTQQIKGIFSGLDNQGCLLLNKDNEIIKITAGDVFFGQTGKN